MANSACPNIKSEQWLKTVEKTSYFEAYRLFVANNFDMPPFAFKEKRDVEKYLNFIGQLNKRGDVWMIPFRGDYGKWMTNSTLVKNEVDRINSIYKGLLTVKGKPTTDEIRIATGRPKIEWVELNEQALKEYYKVYEDPRELEIEAADRGEIYVPRYEQKGNISELTPENTEDFEKKKAIMLKTFPRVTEIIEDTSINQSGLLESNGTIIRVNPNLWTTDTIGHEFGHLLIDLIGGLSNPLIKKARKQLLGSHIETSVKERYQDLVEANDGRIDKEIVAQAIGEETSKIFEEEKDRAAWINTLTRILERIKKILGIEHNAARELARKVLSGKSINKDTVSEISSYEQRAQDAVKERINSGKKDTTTIESLRSNSLKALQKKYNIYSKKNFKIKLDTLEEVLNKVIELDKDPVESLKLIQDFAIDQTKLVYDSYSNAKRLSDKFKKGEEGGRPFTLKGLSRWKDYISGFNMLDELAKFAENAEVDVSEKEFLDKDKLSEAIRQKGVIVDAYKKEGIPLLAKFLKDHSKHIEAAFREDAQREYNTLSKAQKDSQTKDEYVERYLKNRKQEIGELTEENILQELSKIENDIDYAMRWVDNVLDSPDVVVSTLSTVIQKVDFKARQEYLGVQDELLIKVKALEDYYKDKIGILKNPKAIYEFMLEKDKNGKYTQNIISVYKSSLWDDYNTYKKKLEASNLSYDDIQEKMKRWSNQNMPVNSDTFTAAKIDFYDGLLSKGIITEKQNKKLKYNDSYEVWLEGAKLKLTDLVTEDAAEIIHDWYKDNLWKYRTPIETYKNPQWLELVNIAGGTVNMRLTEQIKLVEDNKVKDPRLDFYNFINKQNNKIQEGIPYSHRLHTRLPSVLKETSERIVDRQGAGSIFKHAIKSELNVLADESERGERVLTDESGKPVHFIPIYYTSSLKKYYENEYDKLSDLEKEKITKENYSINKAEENQSYDLASIYSKYYNSAIHYKYKSQILPEIEMAKFLVENRQIVSKDGKGKVIRDTQGNETYVETNRLAEQLGDFIESSIYGIKEKDQGAIFGGTVDVQKAAGLLNKYTAFNLLGLNVVQGVNNITLGKTMQIIEAAGGQHYKSKDLKRANIIYTKNLPGILGDIGSRKPNNIVSLLLRKFDILNEYETTTFRKTSKFRQLLSANRLFFMSEMGEHLVQTQVLLAMLNKLQAKDKSGNVLGNMIDQYSVIDGKLTLNDKVVNFSEEQQAEFEHKVRRVLSPMHGEYGELGRVAIQRLAIGKMAYMFRKFVVPGIKRRYMKKQVNNGLGEYVEGNYRTTGRFFMMLMRDIKNFQIALMATDWQSLTDMEKSNIRKTLTEIAFLTVAIILANIFMNMKEDDDDDNDWILSFLAFQALRYKTESLFFTPKLDEAMKILRSPAASMSTIENTIKLISQMMPPDFDGFERYERGSWKGRYKIEKTAINFIPGLKQIYRTKYVEDQLQWLN